VGQPVGRRMERMEAIIKWVNDKEGTKFAFEIEEKVYLLKREAPLTIYNNAFKLIYNEYNKRTIEEARVIWKELKQTFNFKEVIIE
jgi:hypothetical protein